MDEAASGQGTVVLAVDDEPTVRNVLSTGLAEMGFHVFTASGGQEALALFEQARPDVVLLDVMMPGMSGVEVARKLREKSPVPIILLTALGSEQDIISGLDAGADDYMVKPFRLGELAARIRAAFRRFENLNARPKDQADNRVAIGSQILDREKRALYTEDGSIVSLSTMEFRLLSYMVDNRGRLLTHLELTEQLWGPGHEDRVRYLRVYIRAIRTKLHDDGRHPRFLHSHYGEGYVFDIPD